MSQIPHTSPFDGIRHEDEHGKEFWSARELYKLLGYSRWEKFQKSIEEAKIACENSGQAVSDHFHLEVQLIATGKSEPARGSETSNLSVVNVNIQCEASRSCQTSWCHRTTGLCNIPRSWVHGPLRWNAGERYPCQEGTPTRREDFGLYGP